MQIKNLIIQQQKIIIQNFENFQLSVLRLDELDPLVSGNKLFKLYYLIKDAIEKKYNKIATLGGPYSNHLLATAKYAQLNNLIAVGIIKSYDNMPNTSTLNNCKKLGMEFYGVNNKEYKILSKNENVKLVNNILKNNNLEKHYFIPEGGYSILAAKGASEINKYIPENTTHIVLSTATATTLAGLLLTKKAHQKILGFSALKGITDWDTRLAFLTQGSITNLNENDFTIFNNHHFGGYAKKNELLINFINKIYHTYNMPLDFVYTAKAFDGLLNLINNNYFSSRDVICFIHTGGLQGNESIKNELTSFY